jgi:hypothetical protein
MINVILFFLSYTLIMIGFAWSTLGEEEIANFIVCYTLVSFLLGFYVVLNGINERINTRVCEYDDIV